MNITPQQTAVGQRGKPEKSPVGFRCQCKTHGGQGGGLQRLAEQPPTGQQKIQEGLGAILQDRRGLPHPPPVSHHFEQALHFAESGKLGGDTLVGVGRIGQVVEGQTVGAHAQITLVHGLAEQALHTNQL